jgi:hypothetical protein
MPCEKYSGRMKALIADAALGALSPQREADLRAHIADCASCRGAFDAAQAVYSAIDRGLASLVATAPSPQFELRLRARLAAEATPSRARQFWPAWAPVAAGALAVAALLFVALLLNSPRHVAPNATPHIANRLQPNPATPPALGSPTVALAMNPPRQLTPAPHSPREHAGSPVRRVARRAPTHPTEPEVLVEPGQFAAIRAYANAINSGIIDSNQVLAAQQQLRMPLDIAPLDIESAEIAPLKKPDSDDATPRSGDSNRP